MNHIKTNLHVAHYFHSFDQSRSPYRSIFCFLLFSITLFSIGYSGSAWSADDYLEALEAEASNIELDTISTGKPIITKPETTKNLTVSSTQRLEFEKALQNRLPKSFSTYQTLAEKDQEQVIKTFFRHSKQMHLAIRKLYRIHLNKK